MTAMHFEAKKHAYRQTQDGIVVSFVVHPNDICADLAIAPLGTQYVVALAPYTEQRPPSSTGLEHGASIPAVGGSNPPADTNSEPDKVEARRAFQTLPRSQQAGMLLNDSRFRAWWAPDDDFAWSVSEADYALKAHLRITSKRELDADGPVAAAWDAIVAQYRDDTGQSTWERPA